MTAQAGELPERASSGALREDADEALRVSEARFRTFVDHAIDGFFLLDEQLTVIDVNQHACESLGYSREELIGMHPRDFDVGLDEVAIERMKDRIAAGKVSTFETCHRRKDGTVFPVEIRARQFEEGGRRLSLNLVRDITERKRAEEERLAHLWFFESMDRINRAMQGTKDVEGMLSDVLEVMIETFACDRAWLLYPCNPEAPSCRVVMERTRVEFPGAYAQRIEVPVDPDMATMIAAARASEAAVPFSPEYGLHVPATIAEQFGVRSRLVMAIRPKVAEPYLFGLHQCSRSRVWTAQEQRLFQEIGRRLADALTSLLILRSLRESEQRLDEAQRIAHVGYWDRHLDTGRITLSDEACRIFGLQSEQRTVDLKEWHERWLTLIHPEDRPRVAEASATAVLGGPSYDVEYRVVRPGGEIQIIHSRGEVRRDKSGRVQRMFGTMQDITELRRAEQERRASEARFRIFVDHATDAFFLLDDRSIVIDVNRRACESLGYSREELIGMRPPDFDACVDEITVERLRQRTIEGETPAFETYHRRKDGSVFPVEVRGRRFEQDGRRFLATARDITERKRAEQRSVAHHTVTRICEQAASFEQARPKLLQAVAECLGGDLCALWRLDAETGVLHCEELWRNPAVEATKYEAATRTGNFPPGSGLPGRVWATRAPLCVPDVQSAADAPYFVRRDIAVADGLRGAFAFPILLGDQVLGVIECLSREIRHPERDMLDTTATIGSQIGQFIERKRAENALQLSQAKLAHLTRVMTLGELTASIAHEVNQPLGAMVTSAGACARWLAAQPPEMQKAQRALERIAKDGRRASAVIDRIRALIKRQAPRNDWLDLNEILLEVIALAQHDLRRNEIVLDNRLAETLPAVRGDRVQLQQVFLNLVVNAVEAMSEVNDRVRELVIVSAVDGPKAVLIEVQDSGIGLNRDTSTQLFEPFYTTKPQGIGIGLSISRSIVEAHGGRLSATARTPHGAVFRFSLPFEPEVP